MFIFFIDRPNLLEMSDDKKMNVNPKIGVTFSKLPGTLLLNHDAGHMLKFV